VLNASLIRERILSRLNSWLAGEGFSALRSSVAIK
jgi:hypothetical protein